MTLTFVWQLSCWSTSPHHRAAHPAPQHGTVFSERLPSWNTGLHKAPKPLEAQAILSSTSFMISSCDFTVAPRYLKSETTSMNSPQMVMGCRSPLSHVHVLFTTRSVVLGRLTVSLHSAVTSSSTYAALSISFLVDVTTAAASANWSSVTVALDGLSASLRTYAGSKLQKARICFSMTPSLG